ncbi:hypothetical protein [Cyanobium sp. Morenito 9A2]|uniref:hypothetical protein n=1 Tax=Cyanobium sp. Morenito 9A2 TaxID=2823718 RepID=UPI0020CFCD74|nr:hypothetical protein [Cyanobium sp. Morenito 9A2]MCP9850050.1 hypothetical protein [Cyanobium sp. Morenito 9A2]
MENLPDTNGARHDQDENKLSKLEFNEADLNHLRRQRQRRSPSDQPCSPPWKPRLVEPILASSFKGFRLPLGEALIRNTASTCAWPTSPLLRHGGPLLPLGQRRRRVSRWRGPFPPG